MNSMSKATCHNSLHLGIISTGSNIKSDQLKDNLGAKLHLYHNIQVCIGHIKSQICKLLKSGN